MVFPFSLAGVATFWAAPLFAALTLGAAYSRGSLCRVLSTRAMLVGGALSYSLYVTHGVVILFMVKVLDPAAFVAAGVGTKVAVAAVWLAAVAIGAVLGYRLVELPARAALRRWAGHRLAPDSPVQDSPRGDRRPAVDRDGE